MGFKFQAVQAKREKINVKVALMSPSGGGKTFSALRLAEGMREEIKKQTGKDARTLLVNSEGARGRYYADQFTYDIVDLEAPYNPELYTDVINYAVSEGYDILVLDSTSPEWEGKGGCLELQQQAGGKYQDWGKISPRHDKFIDTLALSPIHIIATMKGKDQYEVDKDDRGKVSVKKLGVGAKQREGFEYNFTCTFMIDRDSHMAKCEKDNTHIFEREGDTILSEEFGSKLIKWANSGDGENMSTKKFTENIKATGEGVITEESLLKNNIELLQSLIKSLQEINIEREDIANAIKKYHTVNGKPSANYNSIKNSEIATSVILELEKLKK